jgi:hypothetical protein
LSHKDAREPLLGSEANDHACMVMPYTRHFVSSATRRFDRRFGIGLAVVWNQRRGVVDLTWADSNQILLWLRRIDGLRNGGVVN